MEPYKKSILTILIVLFWSITTFFTMISINLYLGISMLLIGILLLIKRIESGQYSLIIKEDKANHFIYGAILTALSLSVLSPLISGLICVVIAIGKELVGKQLKKNTTFNLVDALATMSGGLFTLIVSQL